MAIDVHPRFSILLGCVALLSLAHTGGASRPLAQNSEAAPQSLPQIVDNLVVMNAERATALERYQGRRIYHLDYTGFPADMHAEMIVDMSYDAPSTKKFTVVSQSGSKWIVDHVFKRLLETEQEALTDKNRASVELNAQNYDFTGVESQDPDEGCSYVLTVHPKIPSKLLYTGRIWVDGRDFAVCRIEVEPAKNPSFWIKKTDIRHAYEKVGDFWLPQKNESVSTMRFGGRAVLTIEYLNYEILAARSLKETEVADSPSSSPVPKRLN